MTKIMGYLQNQIIKIGKEKGFITTSDISRFYQPSKIQMEMNKLVALDYFEEEQDCVSYIKWKYKGEK